MKSALIELYRLIETALPEDHARQVSANFYVHELLKSLPLGRELNVLDLGCGAGGSIDLFKAPGRVINWHGLDINDSPEVASRKRNDGKFYSYNGVDIPFASNFFDVVYSNQVFEHVRYPEKLLNEVCRVLNPVGGCFIGSVSSLEPYHSFSLWNYTPYGWFRLLSDAGLEVSELRPGIDGLALITRHYKSLKNSVSEWWVNSPLNAEIDERFSAVQSIKLINLQKLTYAGHIVFKAFKTNLGELEK